MAGAVIGAMDMRAMAHPGQLDMDTTGAKTLAEAHDAAKQEHKRNDGGMKCQAIDPRTGITWGWADAENNWGGAMNKSLQDLAYIGTHPLVQNTRQSTPPINPNTPKEGWVVYSASDNKLYAYNGTTWDLARTVAHNPVGLAPTIYISPGIGFVGGVD